MAAKAKAEPEPQATQAQPRAPGDPMPQGTKAVWLLYWAQVRGWRPSATRARR
jgi:hypothetical protein